MRLTENAQVAENVSSSLLPGGSLIAAALHRQVMIWSDRGGASRHIGDRWAIRSWESIQHAIGTQWPVPFAEPFELLHAIRLDDLPQVSREANLQQAENPDFLLVGVQRGASDIAVLQGADAKFAADRIKPSQVSVDVLDRLISVVPSARDLLETTLGELGLGQPTIARGVFICPESTLTDYLVRKASGKPDNQMRPIEIVRVDPSPAAMFVGLPMTGLIAPLARIDALPVTPRNNLISAIYYFRLACACTFLWSEGHRPLLSAASPGEQSPSSIAAELAERAVNADSAWGLIRDWADDVQPQVRAREAIANVASMPIRMRDIRLAVERSGRQDHTGLVRHVRKELELRFRRGLLESVGEISADDPRSLPRILDDVARASRDLKPELSKYLEDLVRDAPLQQSTELILAAGSNEE